MYLGDCLEILPALPKVDAVITDPPYGFGYYPSDSGSRFVGGALSRFKRKAVFGYPEILCDWAAMWGKPDEWVTWWPTNKPCGRTSGLSKESEAVVIYGSLYELPMRKRSADAMTRRITESRGNDTALCKDGDVWRDPSPGAGFNHHLRQHPNEKPVSVLERLVRLCSATNEIVLDPFMGSGTTGVACANLGRKFIGIEIEQKFFDTACRRVDNAYRQQRIFA